MVKYFQHFPDTCGSSCTDLYTVALHEIGHNLGLEHSTVHGSIMYPYLGGTQTLDRDDIAGIQALYGKPSTKNPPPSPPASGKPLIHSV